MVCPICRSKQFYIKDPDDKYETYEFEARQGEVIFVNPQEAGNTPEIKGEHEIFCQLCSWHGSLDSVKRK